MDKEFTTDNCSVVPDYDQNECCVDHDWAYWKGGTFQERWDADRKFLACVKEPRSGFPCAIPLAWRESGRHRAVPDFVSMGLWLEMADHQDAKGRSLAC